MPVCRGQQRDEGAPLETVAAYDLFHEKCGAGPVADVLQERDHQEQRNDLCQDLQHRSDTGDHALTEEVRQGVPWHIVLDEHTEPIEERMTAVCSGTAQVKITWKRMNIAAKNVSTSSTGCSRILSTISLRL